MSIAITTWTSRSPWRWLLEFDLKHHCVGELKRIYIIDIRRAGDDGCVKEFCALLAVAAWNCLFPCDLGCGIDSRTAFLDVEEL